jgi:hypothetical protein
MWKKGPLTVVHVILRALMSNFDETVTVFGNRMGNL